MKVGTSLFLAGLLTCLSLCASARAVAVVEPQQWTEPVPLTNVNSDSAETWSPFLSFDGTTLYFSRVRSDTFYYGRIFEATREGTSEPFTSVSEISGRLNDADGHQLFPWVSPDGLRMYYHNEVGATFSLKFSERASVDEPWPIGMGIDELNLLGDRLQAPRLTTDELTIFFNAYEMPGSKGGYDLWTASRPDKDSPFGQVTNLATINTAFSEGAPAISPDGLALLFQSDRNGQYQLFMATRESTDEFFADVEHLSLFDTPGGISVHPFISSDGTELYFMRQFGPDRSGRDIYVSYIPEPATFLLLGLGAIMLRKRRE
jgi:Tol biopolymer transport system component